MLWKLFLSLYTKKFLNINFLIYYYHYLFIWKRKFLFVFLQNLVIYETEEKEYFWKTFAIFSFYKSENSVNLTVTVSWQNLLLKHFNFPIFWTSIIKTKDFLYTLFMSTLIFFIPPTFKRNVKKKKKKSYNFHIKKGDNFVCKVQFYINLKTHF